MPVPALSQRMTAIECMEQMRLQHQCMMPQAWRLFCFQCMRGEKHFTIISIIIVVVVMPRVMIRDDA